MKTWSSLSEFSSDTRSVVTVGNFDGVHKGHSTLIGQVVHRARRADRCSVVVTFEPHTRTALHPDTPQPIMSTCAEKALLVERLGVDHMVCVAFDDAFRRMDGETFVETVLAGQLRAAEWLMGTGHRFGSDHAGPQNSLHQVMSRNDITPLTVELLTAGAEVVSSTGIRAAIGEGDMARAMDMLGHPYLIGAQRVSGKGLGTKLGYPTLNFQTSPPHKVLPPPGVYAAHLQGTTGMAPGALYFGACPTFGERETHFEMHLLADSSDVPALGETGFIWLHRHIREDRTFGDGQELVTQIGKDIEAIEKFFSEET